MNFDQIKQMKKDYMEALKKDGQKIVHEAFAQFFQENPLILAIKWVQYTPYFNDGDVCEFGVNDFTILIQCTIGQEIGDYEDGFMHAGDLLCEEDKSWFNKELLAIDKNTRNTLAKRIKEFRGAIVDNDLFEIVFGNHVTVITNKDGFTIEQFEHE